MRILIINGPNINMLGIREPEIYGCQTYNDLIDYVRESVDLRLAELHFYQSNHEGDLVDAIQSAYGSMDGIVINPAAYTHTSVAILDALKAVGIPAVEVHISNIDAREEYRRKSYPGHYCEKKICGHGFHGYVEAVDYLLKKYDTGYAVN